MNADQDVHQPSLFSRVVLGRLLGLVAAAGSVLLCVVLVLYFQERQHETSLLAQQGRQRVDREYEFLTREIQAVRADVLYLAEQQLLQRFLAGHQGARSELTRDYVRFAMRRSVYDQIRFLDATGKEIVRVNFRNGSAEVVPAEMLQGKADRYYYRDALQLGAQEVFVSQFDLNVEHGEIERPLKPVLRLLTPVLDQQQRSRGLLALNYAGGHLLRRLNELSLPGSTLLLNHEGHYIRGPQPADAWGWLLGHPRTFPQHFPAAWQQIAGQSAGQFADAQGLFTFRRVSFTQASPTAAGKLTRPRSASARNHTAPLILVAYVPRDLQYAASTKLLRQLLSMYAGAMILLVTLGWYWARSAAIRKLQARSIIASEARLRALSGQLLTAQEEERRVISRELHDELGQQVTAIGLDLRSTLKQQDASRAQTLLKRAIEETDHLLRSVHEIASRVRPSVLDDLGLRDAVESLTSEIGQRTGVTVKTKLDLGDRGVSPKLGENVYRILQEGLMNVVKHAQTAQADVTIELGANRLRMTLEDQGVGFDARQLAPSRLGLLGMRERTELLGGRFTLSSQRGNGTRIEVSIPLQHPNH